METDVNSTHNATNDCVNNFTKYDGAFFFRTHIRDSSTTQTDSAIKNEDTKRKTLYRHVDHKPWFDDNLKQLMRSYLSAFAQFHRTTNTKNHKLSTNKKKKIYKSLERKFKREYKQNKGNMLEYLKKYNLKQY